jgi:hypothetical protein
LDFTDANARHEAINSPVITGGAKAENNGLRHQRNVSGKTISM